VLTKALVGGMTIVGNDFRDGILFVPEVLLAANAMKGGMSILKPLLAETGRRGWQDGDRHRQGRHPRHRQEPRRMMMEGAGFEVVDLGINNSVEKYLEAMEREQPDILGCRRC
jgi:5-methyltetrahydrofolate--homocysteine methyltransferase